MVNAENVIKNWTESSGNYSKLIERELASFKRQAWTELILANAGKSGKLKILDVGTGPGFFTIIMSMAGNDVTAIDCTQAMLDEAQNNAKRNGVSPRFLLSDTQETPFDDESFDLIISRNVAWTILDAEKAYAEWRRILRPDGRVLIFDANWNRRLFDENKNSEYLRDVEAVKRLYPDFQVNIHSSDMDEFRRTMPMCARIRPQWDLEALLRVGYSKVSCDTSIGKLIYDEPEQLLFFSNDPAKWNVEGRESFEDLKARITGVIVELGERHEGQTIACFSHGMAIRTLISGIKGISSERIHEILHGDNTCVSLLSFDNGKLEIEYYNDNSHLPPEMSTFANQSWWKNRDKVDFSNLRFIPMDLNEDSELYCRCYRDGWEEAHGTLRGYSDKPYLRSALRVSDKDPQSLMKTFCGDEFAGIIELDPDRMADEMRSLGPELVSTNLSHEQEAKLRELFEA